jgi:two-component system chemotaxis response regulator CheB
VDTPSFDVVATASSAGGIAALMQLVAQLMPDLPASVISVQHLDPRHRSIIDEILSRRTALRVRQAAEGMRIERGTIYVAPPNFHTLVASDGCLHLNQAELVHFLRPSADLLFESVAATFKERAVGVVLSGTGSDGSMGVRAIKTMGGTVIVQANAQFSGMPNAARATGAYDFSLPLDEIGIAINRLVVSEDGE